MEDLSIYATNNGNAVTERCPITNFLSPGSVVPSSPAGTVLLNERRAIVVDSFQQYSHLSLQNVSRFGHGECRELTLRYHTLLYRSLEGFSDEVAQSVRTVLFAISTSPDVPRTR